MNINKVSFVGLGVMGYPMAGFLKKIILMLQYITEHNQRLNNGLKNMVMGMQ